MPNETPAVEHLEGGSKHPLCHFERKTERPCWRPATEMMFREEGPSLCPEHKRAIEATHKMDGLRYALGALEEWTRSQAFDCDPSGDLERHVFFMRDHITEEYAFAAERAEAADHAASEGPPEPGKPNLTSKQWERLARLIMRSDAFNNARTILESIPEEHFGHHDKWATIAALIAAGKEACEEGARYRREVGIERPVGAE